MCVQCVYEYVGDLREGEPCYMLTVLAKTS